MKRSIAIIALLLAAISSSALAGGKFYITVTGTTTKTFKGEVPSGGPSGHQNDQLGLAYSYELTVPTNQGTGIASGKRQHSPITITKEWGASSPQFFNAMVHNEVLPTVVFTFVTTDPNGGETPWYTITLTNAVITHIRAFKDLYTSNDITPLGTPELESISFTFQRIDIASVPGKTNAADSWKQ